MYYIPVFLTMIACLGGFLNATASLRQEVYLEKNEQWATNQIGSEGVRHFLNEEYEDAIEHLEKYFSMSRRDGITIGRDEIIISHNLRYCVYLACAYGHTGREDEGLSILKHAFDRLYEDQEYYDLYTYLLKCEAFPRYAELALPLAEKIGKDAHWSRSILQLYAKLQAKTGQHAKAIQAWNRFLRTPVRNSMEGDKYYGDFSAQTEMALLFHKMGKHATADTIFHQLEVAAADFPDGFMLMAGACSRDNVRLQDALQWIRKALAIDEQSNYTALYAELLYQTGDFEGAVHTAERLVEMARGYHFQKKLEKYREKYKQSP